MLKKPTKVPSKTDWAWAAGVYEGEGSAQLRPTTTYCCVVQKDPWLIKKFLALFGGNIFIQNRGRNTQLHRWYLTGPSARKFLKVVSPMLSPWRKKQARKAIGRFRTSTEVTQ